MRSHYPQRGRRYGTILVTAALLVACGATTASLPAQNALLDKNRQAFPVAPAAGSGALARGVRDALASVVPALRQQRFPTRYDPGSGGASYSLVVCSICALSARGKSLPN